MLFVAKRRRKVLFGQAAQVGRSISRIGAAEGVPDHGGTPAAGPCAHVHRDSSEVSGGLSDRISKREERHSDGPLVWQGAEFHGRALLGPWIRGVHGGFRVGASPQLHPRTRGRGW